MRYDIFINAIILTATISRVRAFSLKKLLFPQAVEDSDVNFYLCDKTYGMEGIHLTDLDEPKLIADKNSQVVILIHGWTQNRFGWYQNLTRVLLSRTDKSFSVIQVDYSGPASQGYSAAVADADDVGRIIAKRLAQLIANMPLRNIHVVGHSLGGQVAGMAGKYFESLTGQKLYRITAADPAGPLFSGFLRNDKHRLARTDAVIVEVIHTDGGAFGYYGNCGTIDVFANGGTRQPGCNPFKSVFCSHHRSYHYLTEAFQTGSIRATKCSDYLSYLRGRCRDQEKIDIVGDISPEQTGNYYFRTNSDPPYATADGGSK